MFPFVPILGVASYALVLIGTILDPAQRTSILTCLGFYVIIYIAFHFYTKKKGTKLANVKMD